MWAASDALMLTGDVTVASAASHATVKVNVGSSWGAPSPASTLSRVIEPTTGWSTTILLSNLFDATTATAELSVGVTVT